jgi:hypothetical protein
VDRRQPLESNEWAIAIDGALAEAAARCNVQILVKVTTPSPTPSR